MTATPIPYRTIERVRVSTVRRSLTVLIAADPGRIRLRSATTTTLALSLAMAAMLVFTRLAGQPISVALLGAVVAMQSSAAVKDRDQAGRIVTTLLLFIPAVAAVTLAAVLSPLGKVADVGFIAVLFGAVWVRRFGPRGNALGMVAFISYFFGLFLRVTPEQVPVLALAVVVGIAATLLVRTVVLPDRPRVEGRRLLAAFRTHSSLVLEALDEHAGNDIDTLRRRLEQLGATALLIDDWMDRHEAARSFSVTSRELALNVFEAQIMLEQSATMAWSMSAADRATGTFREAHDALAACLRQHPSDDGLRRIRRLATAALERADLTTDAGVATVSAVRATQAHLAIHHITTNARRVSSEREPEHAPPDVDADEHALHPSTKAAIQVAVATSAATVLGELISPDRWYWAVLTSFLVFTGVTTRGEILSRAGHRIVGTIAGVVAGVLLAALIGHRPPIQVAVLFVCVFCAFYLAAVAYFWLTFFVTVLLAMLYGLLGTFSWDVFELRIAETAAGGSVGIAAAFFVFATKTRTTFAARVEEYLDHLSQVIDAGVEAVLAPGGATDVDASLVADTRRLDNALQCALTAGRPLQMGLTSEMRHGVRRLLRGLQIGNRSAHAIARAGVNAQRADPAVPPSEGLAQALRGAAHSASEKVATLQGLVLGTPADEPRDHMAIADVMPMPDIPPGPVRAAVRALNRLDRTLAEVMTRL